MAYMNQSGFKFYYPMLMSFIIFAGSVVEFATVSWLGSFDPVNIFFLLPYDQCQAFIPWAFHA